MDFLRTRIFLHVITASLSNLGNVAQWLFPTLFSPSLDVQIVFYSDHRSCCHDPRILKYFYIVEVHRPGKLLYGVAGWKSICTYGFPGC